MDEKEYLIIECPHCKDFIQIYKCDINCGIFRHAILKDNYNLVNPHLSRELCEQLIFEKKIFGCCKPFQIQKKNNIWNIEICDYI